MLHGCSASVPQGLSVDFYDAAVQPNFCFSVCSLCFAYKTLEQVKDSRFQIQSRKKQMTIVTVNNQTRNEIFGVYEHIKQLMGTLCGYDDE